MPRARHLLSRLAGKTHPNYKTMLSCSMHGRMCTTLLRHKVHQHAIHCARHGHASTAAAAANAKHAAFLVIGSEILNGSIQDTNTPFLAKLLQGRGIALMRVEFVPDDETDISTSIQALKHRVGPDGYVFTSGGIGPTHDDVTYQAVAHTFGTHLVFVCDICDHKFTGVSLQLHEPTVAKMRAHYASSGQELNAARLRMATLPQGAEVLDTPGLWVPLVNLHNVLVLPGMQPVVVNLGGLLVTLMQKQVFRDCFSKCSTPTSTTLWATHSVCNRGHFIPR